jgi:hypothetical protein
MSNEKQNNSWTGKLDELEQHPDAAFSKAAAWDKLYERLEEKPRRKKGLWYVAAAACLLVVAIVSWMVLHTKEPLLVKKTTAPTQPVTAPAQAITVDKAIVEPVTPPLTARQQKNNTAEKHSTVIAVKPVRPKLQQTMTVAGNAPEMIAITAPAVVKIPNAPSVTVVASTPTKKLKVVHLNELDNSMEDEVKMAKSAGRHSFQVKFNGRDPFAEPVPVVPQRTNDIKIKLPPQN